MTDSTTRGIFIFSGLNGQNI